MALLKFHTQRSNNRTPEERREAQEFGKTGEQMTARYLTDGGLVEYCDSKKTGGLYPVKK